MFDRGVSGEVAGDVAATLRARHARIAREQYLEIEAVTDLFVRRCEEDERAGRNEAGTGSGRTSRSPVSSDSPRVRRNA